MSPSQPNIIVITTDQQRCDSLSCYAAACTSTPNIDRLATGSALFERAYCANPVCTPARASIFSGQDPSRHGAWNVGTNVPQDTPCFPTAWALRVTANSTIWKATRAQCTTGGAIQSTTGTETS